MMKYLKHFLFLGIILIIISCSDDGHKKIIVEDPNGFFKEEYIVINDSIKDGMYLKYFSNGKLNDSCFYRNDTIVGIRKLYSDEGYIEISETYKDGVLNGPYIIYYPSGKIKIKQSFSNNILSDYSYRYFPDGILMEKVQIKNGLENGEFEEYYASGKMHWKGTYIDGENEHDTLYEFNLSGELKRKLFCQLGVCNTVWTLEKGIVEPDVNTKIDEELLKKNIEVE